MSQGEQNPVFVQPDEALAQAYQTLLHKHTYLIVMVDQQKATLLNAAHGQLVLEARLEIDIDTRDYAEFGPYALGASVQGGLFEKMVAEHRKTYFQSVVERIDQLCREKGFQRILFGGAEASALMVRNMLPKHLQPLVIGVVPMPITTDPETILEKARPVALEYERAYQLRLVDEIVKLAKSRGRGALGMHDVMTALDQQRVELLVLPSPSVDQELADMLAEQVTASSGQVEWVSGEAADRLNAEGGIGARLYYAL